MTQQLLNQLIHQYLQYRQGDRVKGNSWLFCLFGFHKLLSADWKPSKASGIIPVHHPMPEIQGREYCKSQSKSIKQLISQLDRQEGRGQILPSSTFSSQFLSGQGDIHPHRGGQLTESTNLDANVIQKYPRGHILKCYFFFHLFLLVGS